MMRQRIFTAMILVATLIVVVLWLPENMVLGVLALFVLAGAWEWSSFPRFAAPAARVVYVLAVACAMGVAWYWTLQGERLQWLLWLTLLWWAAAFFWVTFAPTVQNQASAVASGFLVLVPAWVALGHLYLRSSRGLPARRHELVLFLLLLVWAADIGAFFAGRRFGRLKLAPHVSPSKTWEGLIGGVLVSAVVAAVGVWWFKQPPLAFLPLCIGVVLISVVGDLTESMFKRFAGLKDSGSIFPGHGGVLDRFDSITAAAPIFLLGLKWLELSA
jgi:phosphatidate cytidylyltransferase